MMLAAQVQAAWDDVERLRGAERLQTTTASQARQQNQRPPTLSKAQIGAAIGEKNK